MEQTIIIIAIVSTAALYVARRYARTLKGVEGCACSGECPGKVKRDCGGSC